MNSGNFSYLREIGDLTRKVKKRERTIAKLVAVCRALYAEVGTGSDLDWHLRKEGHAERLAAAIAAAEGATDVG